MYRPLICVAFGFSIVAAGPASAQAIKAKSPAQPPPLSSPVVAVPAIGGPGFLTQAEVGQYRASQLVGVNIFNAKDETIGDVNELLVDKNGAIQAVVIGVGGFLGIGEKNVALPYATIRWEDSAKAAPSVAVGPANDTTGTIPAPLQPAVRDYPDHGVLNMTKAQLEAAPAFKFASEATK